MTDKISQEKLQEYAEAFEMWDMEGEGIIQVKHIDCVLNALGVKIPAASLEAMTTRKLQDGETTASFEEFLYLIETGGTAHDFEEKAARDRSIKLKQALGLFDPSQTGTISVVNLRKALRDLMKENEIEELVKKADLQDNGKIDCGYLAELMTGV